MKITQQDLNILCDQIAYNIGLEPGCVVTYRGAGFVWIAQKSLSGSLTVLARGRTKTEAYKAGQEYAEVMA